MSEQELELLITLDDPEGAPEEDTFQHAEKHLSIGSTPRGQQPPGTSRDKQEE